MADVTRVSSTDFSKEVGRYQDLALTQPIVITRNGRDRTVMISAKEYGRLKHLRIPAADDAIPPVRERKRLDADTRRAVASFIGRIKASCTPAAVLVYGSRARGTHAPESDVDIAVILKGEPQDRYGVLGPLADAAYDVLMETGIHIQPLPLWDSELKRPELFGNPALIATIKREGVRV